MSFVSNRFTVVLDANVLVGSRKRDILLWFSFAGLFRARWSLEILEETEKALLEKRGWPKEKVQTLIGTLNEQFPHSLVQHHSGLADHVDLPDKMIGTSFLRQLGVALKSL